MNDEFRYPLIPRKWRWLGFTMFGMPFIILALAIVLPLEFPQEAVSDLFYAFWAIGFGILISVREKQEDEMVQQMRLKAFQMGVFFLMAGVIATICINLIRTGSLLSDWFSGFTVIWLLHTYIYATFQYLKWKSKQDEE